MKDMFLWLVLAVFSRNVYGVSFSPSIASIESNSTCINAELCDTINGTLSCSACSSDPRYAVDGDSQSQWSTLPVADLPNGTAELTIFLEQVNILTTPLHVVDLNNRFTLYIKF